METDRLLGQQRLDDHGFGDEKVTGSKIHLHSFASCVHLCLCLSFFLWQSWADRSKVRSIRSPSIPLISKNHTAIRAGVGTQISAESPVKNVGITNVYGNGGTIPMGSDKEELSLQQEASPDDKSPVLKSVSVVVFRLFMFAFKSGGGN